MGASGAMQSASPVYGGNLALNYELEQGQRFFRAKLNGKLTFYREDYDTIIAAPFGTVFYLYMEKSTDPAGLTFAPYYKSKFTITDCTVNVDDRLITVQPQTTDQYDEVLAGMDNEYNLITLTPAMNSVQASKRPLVQVYEAGADIINNYIAGTSWEQSCTANANKNELGHKFWFGIDTIFTKIDINDRQNYAAGYFNTTGNLVENADYIHSTDYIPVKKDDVVTWEYGNQLSEMTPTETVDNSFFYTQGDVRSNSNFAIYKYAVLPNGVYAFSGKHSSSVDIPFVCWYDANGNFIRLEDTQYASVTYTDYIMTAPSNAAFAWFNVQKIYYPSIYSFKQQIGMPQACMIEYDSAGNVLDYWTGNANSGSMAITMAKDNVATVRVSFLNSYKANARVLVNNEEVYRPLDNIGFNGTYSGKVVRTGVRTEGVTTYEEYNATFENDGGATDYYIEYNLYVRAGYYEDWWYGTINVKRRAGGTTVTEATHRFMAQTFNSGWYSFSGSSGGFSAYIDNIFMMARWLTDAESVEGITLYELPVDDIAGENRNYHRVAQVSVGCCYVSNEVIAVPNEYGIAEDTGTYYFAPPSSLSGEWYMPIAQSQWSNRVSYWFAYHSVFQLLEQKGVAAYTLRNAYPLWSCLSVLLAATGSSVTFQGTSAYSEFLYSERNPLSGELVKLFVTPKSNILAGDYSVPAQKAMTTLGQFLDMLRKVYQLYWFIDASNRLRIEHIRWFKNGGSYANNSTVGIDLTELLEKRNATAWAYGVNEYTYEKEEMPQRYQFEWMDDERIPFKGEAIEILSPAVTEGKVESVSVGNFSSDIDYMLLNPSVFSQDGFALIGATGSGNSWSVPFITYTQAGVTISLQNGYLSFFSLQPTYWVYDLPAKAAKINGIVYSLSYVSRRKTQRVTIPLGISDPDFLKLVKTNMGNGEIRAVSIPLSSRVAQVTLNYDTE